MFLFAYASNERRINWINENKVYSLLMTPRVINELKQRLLRRIPSIDTNPIEKTVPYINTTPSKNQ